MKGEQLRRIRERLGLTQEQMAYRVGVTPNTIARWERNEMSIGGPAARLVRGLAMVKTKKSFEVKMKDGRTLFFEGVTDHSATDHRLKLYRGVDVVAHFDMIDVRSWFAPDHIDEENEG